MNGSRFSQTTRRQHCAGVSLIECLVYIAVFALLMTGGTASFYFCWDHTRATIFTANEIESAVRAGETWRADVRTATGNISVETTPTGELVKIPGGGKEILYRLTNGELRRDVTAWRWELEVTPRRKEAHLPLLFTFAAVQPKP